MECQELERGGIPEKYLNRQLDPATQDEFELHILECQSCQRTLELLQTVRDDLAAHAHEIRAHSSAPRGYLRWKWVAVAAMLIVMVSGGWLRWHRKPEPAVAKQPIAPHANQSAGSNTSIAYGRPDLIETARSRPSTPSGKERDLVATNLENLPINERNYRNLAKLDSQMARDNAPNIGEAPTSGLDFKGQRARSNLGTATGADASDNSINGIRSTASQNRVHKFESAHASQARNQPEDLIAEKTDDTPRKISSKAKEPASQVPEAGTSAGTPAETSATAIAVKADSPASSISDELAKLSAVRPFPYTFAGVVSSQPSSGGSARVKRQPESALSGNPGAGVKPGASGFATAQDYFREGMSAYVDRDYNAATNLLAQAVDLEPDFSEANLYLGICKLLRGSPSEAISPLQMAAKDDKKPALSQAAHYFLAKTYLQLGKPTDAESEFRSAAALPGRLAGESNELLQRLDRVHSEPGK